MRIAFWANLLLFAFTWPQAEYGQSGKGPSRGIAWEVRGVWRTGEETGAIRTGDPIFPDALLRPDASASDHSITILLPDGQRILYECFTAQDCERGFRVPSLYRKPEAFAVDLLAQVRATMATPNQDVKSNDKSTERLPQDEIVTTVANHRVKFAGLAASLQNGSYTYEIRPLSTPGASRAGVALEKSSREITVAIPAPGLYAITITDASGRPRIDLLIGAIAPTQNRTVAKPFDDARALFKDWNEDYQGWPVHAFLRAYLKSLMLGIKAPPEHRSVASSAHPAGVTLEPRFTPLPGVFKGDTSVTLRCAPANAAIHYTVDGSQPLQSSPVYQGPIMVKGTELTIKAFASAPGSKDSSVVTGIFRIEQ